MKLNYIMLFTAVALLASCDLSDPGGEVDLSNFGVTEAGSNEEADAKSIEMGQKYGLTIQYEFLQDFYEWNWTELVAGISYTPADPEHVVSVLKFLDEEVFSAFPENIIKQYLQPNVLLVDSLYKSISVKFDDSSWTPKLEYTGGITQNLLIFANVSDRFDSFDKQKLKEEWISLIIEKMYPKWPEATDFLKRAYAKYPGSLSSGHWWYNQKVDSPNTWTSSGEPEGIVWEGETIAQTPASMLDLKWYKAGLLKKGRLQYTGVSIYTSYGVYWFTTVKPAYGQDLGDYFTFITVKTEAERQAFYNLIEANPSSHGGPAATAIIKDRIVLVQKYFKDNFGMTLTPKP